MSEQDLIAARKRLDDAEATLRNLAMMNSPISAEEQEKHSARRAMADLEWQRAHRTYNAILEALARFYNPPIPSRALDTEWRGG